MGPELKQHTNGADLARNTEPVAVNNVPSERKAKRGIDEKLGVPHKGAGYREESGHFAQRKLDGTDDEADERVAEEGTERAAGLDGAAQGKEETGTDSPCR